jgi:DNA-binding NtrC family response regulator
MGSQLFNPVGSSPVFQTVLRSAKLVAAADVTVLIQGESGTGKELLAHMVHAESRRAGGPFVSINCAALPEPLAESELFGHRKGAFTGAHCDVPGRVRTADGGTLFLDEVGELPLAVQAKLLRFLESGECQGVGEAQPRRVNVRVVAATNRDLAAMVEAGQFRADLFYRLNVVPLELPPLRERASDLNGLLKHLMAQLAAEHGLAAPRFETAVLKLLKTYRWPGNVRELRNFCERMLVLFHGRSVAAENLPQEIRVAAMPASGKGGFLLPDTGIKLDELEVDMIRQALHKTRGNRSRAARLLGLSRDTLLYRIRKYAINT